MTDLNRIISENRDQESKSRANDEVKYAVLMETSGEECESWYFCIRYSGNEENLKHLNDQLESLDWYILEGFSTFDLDLEHLISETTAKELTKLELNSYSFHRKFDGVLDKIDLKLKKNWKNDKKIARVFNILGYGKIEDYIDKEDLDSEDLVEACSSEDEDMENEPMELAKSLEKLNIPSFHQQIRMELNLYYRIC